MNPARWGLLQQRPSPDGTLSANAALSVGAPPADKPFAEVIQDARAALDAGYERLGKKGDNKTTWYEWQDDVGIKNLDRRTLFAIASNQGGLFSKDEVSTARGEMASREAAAMTAADPSRKNIAAMFKASVDFHDSASPEEKASLEWAMGRASAQRGYQDRMVAEGRIPENVDTGMTLVELFLRANEELVASNDMFGDLGNMPSYKGAIEYWEMSQQAAQKLSWTL